MIELEVNISCDLLNPIIHNRSGKSNDLEAITVL